MYPVTHAHAPMIGLEGNYASSQTSPHRHHHAQTPPELHQQDLSSSQLVINHDLGLTLLPGSQALHSRDLASGNNEIDACQLDIVSDLLPRRENELFCGDGLIKGDDKTSPVDTVDAIDEGRTETESSAGDGIPRKRSVDEAWLGTSETSVKKSRWCADSPTTRVMPTSSNILSSSVQSKTRDGSSSPQASISVSKPASPTSSHPSRVSNLHSSSTHDFSKESQTIGYDGATDPSSIRSGFEGRPFIVDSGSGIDSGEATSSNPVIASSATGNDSVKVDCAQSSTKQPTPTTEAPALKYTDDRPPFQRESSVDSLFDEDTTQETYSSCLSLPPPPPPPCLSLPPPPPALAPAPPPPLPPPLPVPNILRREKNSSFNDASHQLIRKHDIRKEDILACKYREIFRSLRETPKYISPYPEVGGPLGYLPSNPTLHVKSVEVAEDAIVSRIEGYRQKLKNLRYELNKHELARRKWETVDHETGKSMEQKLKEELMFTRRALSVKREKAKQATEEANFWQAKYRNLVTFHSRNDNSHPQQQCMRLINYIPPPTNLIPTPATTPTSTQPQRHPLSNLPANPPNKSAVVNDRGNAVAIDLTTNEHEKGGAATVQVQGQISSKSNTKLNEMRRKKYMWLNDQNNHSLHPAVPSIRNPAVLEGEGQQSASSSRDELEEGYNWELTIGTTENSSLTSESCSPFHTGEDDELEDDDELARMLLEELEGSS